MQFSLYATETLTSLLTTTTQCLVLGVFEDKQPTDELATLLPAGGDTLSYVLGSGDMSGKVGSTNLFHALPGIRAERILVVGLGKKDKFSEKSFIQAVRAATNAFKNIAAEDATFALPFTSVKDRTLSWALKTTMVTYHEGTYRADTLKSKREPSPIKLTNITLTVPKEQSDTAIAAWQDGVALVQGLKVTKDVANLPANICTPTYLAEQAQELAAAYDFGIEVLEPKQIEALKMGSFLSVARGSDEPARFIVLKHLRGDPKAKPVVLVGKGITFDTGGISIKPAAAMDEMKYDMCGAASVLGVFKALGGMNLPLNVIGIIPTCENMPSGRATKPGDIVTSMSGQTIEVLNTDAEGRLILCDALTYAERFEPAAVVDMATLTGACVVALGSHNSGLFTRSDAAHNALADALLAAGKESNDTAWRMPLDERYDEQLASNFADIANIGTPGAGSVTAACFLERFTRKYTWAHLDIAGTAHAGGAAKGATGRPVPLLVEFLIQRARPQ